MRKRKATSENLPVKKLRPAISPEARENQMISLAVGLAEKQLMEGTASSQVISLYLKRAIQKEKDDLELEKLREENKLLRAKTEAIQAAQRTDEFYIKVINSMKEYSGEDDTEEDDEDLW